MLLNIAEDGYCQSCSVYPTINGYINRGISTVVSLVCLLSPMIWVYCLLRYYFSVSNLIRRYYISVSHLLLKYYISVSHRILSTIFQYPIQYYNSMYQYRTQYQLGKVYFDSLDTFMLPSNSSSIGMERVYCKFWVVLLFILSFIHSFIHSFIQFVYLLYVSICCRWTPDSEVHPDWPVDAARLSFGHQWSDLLRQTITYRWVISQASFLFLYSGVTV